MYNHLIKNIIFVKSFEAYDFTDTMGQLAVKIEYTNGDTDMFTTKSTNTNVFDNSEFETHDEFYDFIKYLQANDIKKL